MGRTWPCFLKALASEGVAVLMEDFTFVTGEEDTRVLVEGLVVLKGDLTTVSTEVVVEQLSARLEGEKEGSGSIPARQTAGKTIGGRVLLRLNAKVCTENRSR